MRQGRDYRPIADYACIGDCHGAALVARDGSIDWACLRRFDADPIFNRLLDRRRGGYFQIEPAVEYRPSREYLTGTNVLRTVFATPRGAVALTDFMPVGRVRRAATHDYVSLRAPFWIVRRLEGLHGEVPVRVIWRPSAGFARDEPVLRASGDRVQDRTGQMLVGDVELRVEDDAAVADLLVRRGDTRDLLVSPEPLNAMPDPAAVRRHLEVTCAFWTEWLEYGRYAGPHGDAVRRSALALKLLTYAPTLAKCREPPSHEGRVFDAQASGYSRPVANRPLARRLHCGPRPNSSTDR